MYHVYLKAKSQLSRRPGSLSSLFLSLGPTCSSSHPLAPPWNPSPSAYDLSARMAPISEIYTSTGHARQYQSHHVICASQTWHPAPCPILPSATCLSFYLAPRAPWAPRTGHDRGGHV
ncbi:hypothetical protein LY76DRAFT_105776 [Colletotrichum caudatum]|nr:hypothetical protein LY76DRAFT_105776 [Colletotrichum caudatum]